MNERIGAKKGKTRRLLSLSLSLSLLCALFIASIYFQLYGVIVLQKNLYNCNRLVQTGSHMFVNQGILSLSFLITMIFSFFPYQYSSSSFFVLREVYCYSVQMMSNKQEALLSQFFRYIYIYIYMIAVFRFETLSNKSIAASEQ